MTQKISKSPVQELFEDQVADIYYAEKELVKALPKMKKNASNPQLAAAFEAHCEETKGHVARLEQVFELLGKAARAKKCEAIVGLLKEADEITEEFKDTDAIDAALIAASQKVEHYEIATYGTLASLADQLGLTKAKKLLGATLDEEKAADEKLSSISDTANATA
tara:strand:- start:63 stop:557 length:495 start_codon:yes stop_codon:yes gene_type:complete